MSVGSVLNLCGPRGALSRGVQDQRGVGAWSAGHAGRRAFSAAITAERVGASPSATGRSAGRARIRTDVAPCEAAWARIHLRAVWTAGLAGAGLRVMRTTARPMIR